MGLEILNVSDSTVEDVEDAYETGIKFYAGGVKDLTDNVKISVRFFGNWMCATVIKGNSVKKVNVNLDLDNFIFEGFLFYYKGEYWEVFSLNGDI